MSRGCLSSNRLGSWAQQKSETGNPVREFVVASQTCEADGVPLGRWRWLGRQTRLFISVGDLLCASNFQ
jgi:hypothetical protein